MERKGYLTGRRIDALAARRFLTELATTGGSNIVDRHAAAEETGCPGPSRRGDVAV